MFCKKQTDTIQYHYFENQKDSLVVILPGASLLPRSHDNLIKLLSKRTNVLLVEDGYFGLRILDGKHKVTDQNRTTFFKNMHEVITTYQHKKLVILASSVGTIHGLTYALNFPDKVDTLVLAALPIGLKLLNFIL